MLANFSPIVTEFRNRLDDLSINWYDASEIAVDEDSNIPSMVFERTRIPIPNDTENAVTESDCELSVVYIYSPKGTMLRDKAFGYSYGYPNQLECWGLDWCSEPVPMAIEDIIFTLKAALMV